MPHLFPSGFLTQCHLCELFISSAIIINTDEVFRCSLNVQLLTHTYCHFFAILMSLPIRFTLTFVLWQSSVFVNAVHCCSITKCFLGCTECLNNLQIVCLHCDQLVSWPARATLVMACSTLEAYILALILRLHNWRTIRQLELNFNVFIMSWYILVYQIFATYGNMAMCLVFSAFCLEHFLYLTVIRLLCFVFNILYVSSR
jgi:hypothetical protein